jgi:hypothetical protein
VVGLVRRSPHQPHCCPAAVARPTARRCRRRARRPLSLTSAHLFRKRTPVRLHKCPLRARRWARTLTYQGSGRGLFGPVRHAALLNRLPAGERWHFLAPVGPGAAEATPRGSRYLRRTRKHHAFFP